MAQDVMTVLGTSENPEELYAAAVSLLKSADPNDHATLLRFLSRDSFLTRLDTEAAYRDQPKRLRIARILKALRESEAPTARAILVQLTRAPEFAANWTRADLLIDAIVDFRPPPEDALRFWDAHCQPEDGFMNRTIRALARNGTEPAIALLEEKLAAPGFEDEEKTWWMRTAVMTHRNDPLVLCAAQRLLEHSLPEHLRPTLVEALFDYQPELWNFPDSGDYQPPALENASPGARELMIEIGRHALHAVPLSDSLRRLVKEKVRALEEMH